VCYTGLDRTRVSLFLLLHLLQHCSRLPYPRKSYVANHCNLPASASDMETIRLASVSPSSFPYPGAVPIPLVHCKLHPQLLSPPRLLTPSYHPTILLVLSILEQ